MLETENQAPHGENFLGKAKWAKIQNATLRRTCTAMVKGALGAQRADDASQEEEALLEQCVIPDTKRYGMNAAHGETGSLTMRSSLSLPILQRKCGLSQFNTAIQYIQQRYILGYRRTEALKHGIHDTSWLASFPGAAKYELNVWGLEWSTATRGLR